LKSIFMDQNNSKAKHNLSLTFFKWYTKIIEIVLYKGYKAI
jgi:hypothetical protein